MTSDQYSLQYFLNMCSFFKISVFVSLLYIVSGFRTHLDPICKPPRGDVCIDIYDCPFFESILEKKKTHGSHHVIREIRRRQCGFVGKHPAVCCPDMSKIKAVKTKKERVEEIFSHLNHKNLHLLPTEKCGTVPLQFRITNGKQAGLGEYPWVALIVYATKNGLEFLCGGSLISKRYVITAAHCIMSNIMGIRLGEYNIMSSEDCNDVNTNCAPPVQDLLIESIHIHPKYNNKTDHNDIALIRLINDADFSNEYIKPICLPLWNIPDTERKLLTVVGWGVTETGYKSPILKKATLPEVPSKQCQKLFQGHSNIIDSQICAGGKTQDSCNGDSGGPLSKVVPVSGILKEVQYGIVSYGPKSCGTLGMPGIYTRVEHYLQWILDTISP